jgi:hypothetical protein
MRVGPGAESAIPDLENAQKDDNPVLRVLAAVALSRIRGKPESMIPDLLNEIRQGRFDQSRHPYCEYHVPKGVSLPPTDRTFGVSVSHKGAAVWYLGDLGVAAREAMPLLMNRSEAVDGFRPLRSRRVMFHLSFRCRG